MFHIRIINEAPTPLFVRGCSYRLPSSDLSFEPPVGNGKGLGASGRPLQYGDFVTGHVTVPLKDLDPGIELWAEDYLGNRWAMRGCFEFLTDTQEAFQELQRVGKHS